MEEKMWLTARRRYHKLLPVLMIFSTLFFYFPARAQHIEPSHAKLKATSAETVSDNEPAAGPPAAQAPEQSKKIDRAGEKIGQGIDKLTRQASSSIGSWINATVFAGIT